MIETYNLTKKFGKIIAVNNVNLKINQNEIFAIIGPSGCGKTTLLRSIAGLEIPDTGQIIIDNEPVFDANKHIFIPPEKRNIGMVFQIFAVWPHMTVFENVAYPLKHKKLSSDEIKKRVSEVLELVGLSGFESRYPHQLSGGQQQRISLARALIMQPKVILFDEPMSNLDAKLAEKLKIDIKSLIKQLKITAIYVTHDQLEALTVADRIAVMKEGKILEIGTPQELYNNPKHVFTAEFVGVSNKIKGKIIEKYGNSYVKINTSIGNVIGKLLKNDFKIGDDVILFIRVNKIDIYTTTQYIKEKDNIFKGKVRVKSFVGENIIYIIEIDGQELRVHAPVNVNIEEGTDVLLTVDPASLVIFKESE
jgi:iron(III) transport system ATP-binding protein